MIQLDETIDNERLRQFASQLTTIPKDQKRMLEEMIVGDKTPDFYLGLCAGLAASYQIASQPNAKQLIGACLAAASEQALRK